MVRCDNKSRLLYTPKRRIPIGEAIRLDNGQLGLRLKRAGKQDKEDVPLECLYSMVLKAADGYDDAGSPNLEATRSHNQSM